MQPESELEETKIEKRWLAQKGPPCKETEDREEPKPWKNPDGHFYQPPQTREGPEALSSESRLKEKEKLNPFL